MNQPSVRALERSGILALAVALNVLLFAVGVYFELHPRDRHDLWSAAGVAAVALFNSAALTVPPARPLGARFILRLRRITLLANSLLLVVATLIVALEALRGWRHLALHGLALFVPPLLTIGALRLLRPPD